MEEQLLRNLFKEEGCHWWHIAKRKLIREFLPLANKRVLDLGLGGGRLCQELRADGFEVTGVDISPEVCAHIHQSYGIEIIRHDLEQGLPFAQGSFDAIIIADVLEHIKNDKKLLEEIWRCLAGGGILLLTVPSYRHMWSSWDNRLAHQRRYGYEEIKALIGLKNFRIKKITFCNVLIYPAAFIWRKCLGVPKQDYSDFAVSSVSRGMNALILVYYALERFFLRFTSFPLGLSIFVCAEKPQE